MVKRIGIKKLVIELTRRCNASCAHCLRGEAQNIDITKEIIDNLFKNEEHEIVRIGDLFFTGGEPLLNREMFLYVLNYISKHKILVNRVYFITNGLIYDAEIIDLLNKSEYFKRVEIFSGIDQFHPPIPEENLKLYQKLPYYNYDDHILQPYEIINLGRARVNNLGNETRTSQALTKYFKAEREMLIIDGINMDDEFIVLKEIYISSKGEYLSMFADASWNLMDEVPHKNIMNDSLFKECTYNASFIQEVFKMIDNQDYVLLKKLFNEEFINDIKKAYQEDNVGMFKFTLFDNNNFDKYLVNKDSYTRKLV